MEIAAHNLLLLTGHLTGHLAADILERCFPLSTRTWIFGVVLLHLYLLNDNDHHSTKVAGKQVRRSGQEDHQLTVSDSEKLFSLR